MVVGCLLSACAGLPASAQALTEPAPSLFSINTGTYDSSHTNYVRDLPAAAALGARWVRFTADSIHWRGAQPNWTALDYEVRRARSLHLGVLIALGGAGSACSVVPRPADVSGCPPRTPADLRRYAGFLRAELLRYRHTVDTYESWLEPNQTAFWRPYPDPKQYAALLMVQHRVLGSVNRRYHLHLRLLVGGPNGFSISPPSPNGIPVLAFVHQVLIALHGQRVFDGIALQAYRYPERNSGELGADWGPAQPEWDYVAGTVAASGDQVWRQMNWPQELAAYEQQFAAAGYPHQPLWLTEFGWPGVADPAAAPAGQANLYPSEGQQAKWLSEAYGDLLALPFVKAAFVFNLRNYQPGLATPDPAFFGNYGLLSYRFGRKPAAGVFDGLAAAHRNR